MVRGTTIEAGTKKENERMQERKTRKNVGWSEKKPIESTNTITAIYAGLTCKRFKFGESKRGIFVKFQFDILPGN